MNNTYQNKWNEIKNEVLKTWGTLSKDDLDKARENPKMLVESIQKKLGGAQDEIKTKVDGILKRFDVSGIDSFDTSKTQKH